MSWETRLYGDAHRMLIAEECAIICEQQWHPPVRSPSRTPAGLRAADPGKAGFCLRRLARGNAASDESVLVFQAGRYFLVGPTVPGVRALFAMPEFSNATSRPHLHVPLLSWDPGHIEGLRHLLTWYSDPEPRITFWTAEWVWSEMLLGMMELPDGLAAAGRLRQSFAQLGVERAKVCYEPDDAKGVTNAVVLFEDHLDIQLALGVKVAMDFVPAELPSLRVRFECNHLSATIDPFNVIDSQTRLDVLESQLRTVSSQSFRTDPRVLSLLYGRYGELRGEWNGRPSAPSLPGITDAYRCTEQWSVPEGLPEQIVEPIDCSVLECSMDDLAIPRAEEINAPMEKESPGPLKESLGVVVAISCAGLSNRKKRELLDPGRSLSWRHKDRLVSILTWRLHQILEWRDAKKLDVRILLITGPDTRDLVDQEWTRFLDDNRTYERKFPEIDILPVQLAPRIRLATDTFNADAIDDGGWRLDARGHGDLLQVLNRWLDGRKKKDPAFVAPDVCLAFAYNNLGKLFTDGEETIENIRTFYEATRTDRRVIAGVEVFPFTQAELDADWKDVPVSFTDTAVTRPLQPVRLNKRGYPGAAVQFNSEIHVSSHTWYLRCDRIKDFVAYKGYFLVHDKLAGGGMWPRKDLDIVSHSCSTIALTPQSSRKPQDPDAGIHKWQRFRVARTEEDLRSPKFCKLVTSEKDTTSAEHPGKLAAAIGIGRIAVWAGPQIHIYRGLTEKLLAEDWMVSTLVAGLSGVYLRGGRVSLRSVLNEDLRFMVKYLDCQEPLSIQVHPNPRVIAGLKYLQSSNQLRQQLELKDDGFKEESFYVIKAADRDVHLFLGFELSKLQPVADALRPLVIRQLNQMTSGAQAEVVALDKFYGDITERLEELFRGDQNRLIEPFDSDVRESLSKRLDEQLAAMRDDFKKVLTFHVQGLNGLKRIPTPPRDIAPHLPGKEHLFAALGVLRLIAAMRQALTDWIKETQRLIEDEQRLLAENPSNAKTAQVLKARKVAYEKFIQTAFALYGNKNRREVVATDSPILDYFHRVKVEPGTWIRIPPGAVHAWQGGGNLLVELAQCSDNTFRILDYGRELLSDDRRVHYTESMLSLTEENLLGRALEDRLVFKAADTDDNSQHTTSRRAHAITNCQLFQGREKNKAKDPDQDERKPITEWIPISEPEDFERSQNRGVSVILNPTHSVFLRADDKDPDLKLGRLGAAVVLHEPNSYTPIQFLRDRNDEHLLHIYPSKRRNSLLCLSLGETKLEAALRRSGQSPAIDWKWQESVRTATNNIETSLNALIDTAADLILQLPKEDTDAIDRLDVAITWPGHIFSDESHWSDGTRATVEDRYQSLHLVSSMFPNVRTGADVLRKLRSAAEKHSRCIELRKRLCEIGRETTTNSFCLLSDSSAAVLGEVRHPLGGLSRAWPGGAAEADNELRGRDTDPARPGIVLNIGSGTCAAFYAPPPFQKRNFYLTQKTISAVGAVGRWLGVDPRTGHIQRNLSRDIPLSRSLQDRVFGDAQSADGLVRLSPYMSSRGVAVRLLRRLAHTNRDLANERRASCGLQGVRVLEETSFQSLCEAITEQGGVFQPHALFQLFDSDAAGEGNARAYPDIRMLVRNFVVQVAVDIAQVIRHMRDLVTDLIEENPAFAELTPCFERIVLTGIVGMSFGWAGEEDLLCRTINNCLGADVVRRSRIAIASVREVEGFHYFLRALK